MEHKHLIVRAEVLEPPIDCLVIEKWLTTLVIDIGMKIAAGPISYYVTKEGNRGLTAAVVIEISHVAIHVWDETVPALIQFDLYSCGKFDIKPIVEHLQKFKPVKMEYKFLDRNKNLIIIDEGENLEC